MSFEQKIELIQSKLQQLKSLDVKRKLFGSDSHNYLLNPVKSESEIVEFEGRYGISLPGDYRLFLLTLGDGGAGPYYGLQKLEDSLFIDLDYKRKGELLDLSKPFELTSAWNMEFDGDPENEEQYNQFQGEYFSDKWANGLLRICNFGCGVSMNLVVNGCEYGNIWVDDRGSDGGIFPDLYFQQTSRTSFIDWYLLWLDTSSSEFREGSCT